MPRSSEELPTAVPDTVVERDDAAGAATKMTAAVTGYAFGEVIGRGGIGEVVVAHDLRIGREVAVKRLQHGTASEDEIARFMREARIQARLEHPAIPPVHELGKDAAGQPYFAMKRLVGATLHEELARSPDRARVLRAFVEVCLAIEFAHRRGIVHRDLKPGNIMLGEFGEVYVLDWGLARVVGERTVGVVTDDLDSYEVEPGEVLGTPGYMAPEQLRDASAVTPGADVYALGAILYEILAGEPLHPRGLEAIASTLAGSEARPGERRPERAVPPELDALCAAMLAQDPTRRPSARACGDRVQAYLDGDRDLASRRAIATELVWRARADFDAGRRADAMRAAGRALALDPQSGAAGEIITSLMLQPPAEPPAGLASVLAASDAQTVSRHARTATLAYGAVAGAVAIFTIGGVERVDTVIALLATAVAMTAWAWWYVRHPPRSLASLSAYVAGGAVLLALLTRCGSPFIIVPAIACIVVMSLAAYPQLAGPRAWIVIVAAWAGSLGPLLLERAGWMVHTWHIDHQTVFIHPRLLDASDAVTVTNIVLSTAATIAVAGVHASRIYGANREARHRLAAQAWHLAQLLPAPAVRPSPG